MSAKQFVEGLAGLSMDNTFNPWAETCPLQDAGAHAPQDRQKRLIAHLGSPQIEIVLVGEAPGHKGCRYSGMAFTSEHLLMEGAIPGFRKLESRITSCAKPLKEISATIVWGALRSMGVHDRVALWNAFPIHPHNPGNSLSNRTPTQAELKVGATVLRQLVEEVLPKGVRIIAVGGHARDTLLKLGFDVPMDHQVRHPAFGGANEFREGIARLFKAERSGQGWLPFEDL